MYAAHSVMLPYCAVEVATAVPAELSSEIVTGLYALVPWGSTEKR